MKRKACVAMMFMLVTFFVVPNYVQAASMRHIRALIEGGRESSATRELNQILDENPTNAKIRYEAALAYHALGYSSSRDKNFDYAVKFDPSMAHKVANLYRGYGDNYLHSDNPGKCLKLYSRAFNFYSEYHFVTDVYRDILSVGEDYLNKDMPSKADECFDVLCKLSGKMYKGTMAKLFFDKGTTFDDKRCFPLFRYAHKYSNKYDLSIGDRIAYIAKGKSIEERRRYKQEAERYIKNKAEIKKAFPEFGWHEVARKTIVGVGYKGGDEPKYNDGGLNSFMSGRDYSPGDRLIIIGKTAEYWTGSWIKVNGKVVFTIPIITHKGECFSVRAAKGDEITVILEKKGP